MSKGGIIVKIAFRLLAVIAFVFSFLGYVIALRPQIQTITNDYTLGLLEGGILIFVFTAFPLLYTILAEKEKN